MVASFLSYHGMTEKKRIPYMFFSGIKICWVLRKLFEQAATRPSSTSQKCLEGPKGSKFYPLRHQN